MTPETKQALLDMAAHLCRDCREGKPVQIGAELYDSNGHEWWHRWQLGSRHCKAACFHEALLRLGAVSPAAKEIK
jgi:hypothetical protein